MPNTHTSLSAMTDAPSITPANDLTTDHFWPVQRSTWDVLSSPERGKVSVNAQTSAADVAAIQASLGYPGKATFFQVLLSRCHPVDSEFATNGPQTAHPVVFPVATTGLKALSSIVFKVRH
jgi:hypothetical protein